MQRRIRAILILHNRRREVALDGGKSAARQLNAGTQLRFEVVWPVPSVEVSGGGGGSGRTSPVIGDAVGIVREVS